MFNWPIFQGKPLDLRKKEVGLAEGILVDPETLL